MRPEMMAPPGGGGPMPGMPGTEDPMAILQSLPPEVIMALLQLLQDMGAGGMAPAGPPDAGMGGMGGGMPPPGMGPPPMGPPPGAGGPPMMPPGM